MNHIQEMRVRQKVRAYVSSSSTRLSKFAQDIQLSIYSRKMSYEEADRQLDEFELGVGVIDVQCLRSTTSRR